MPTVRAVVDGSASALREAGVETARVDAEWLLAHVLDVPRSRLVGEGQRTLDAPAVERYAAVLRRRLTREPLQHILGTQAFRNLHVRVGPQTMVPRPETEALVDWALGLLPDGSALVVDVGTGSGCIACAIAAERPGARVIALEISAAAAAVARANVAALALSARVRVVESDLFSALGGEEADLIVANPPYLPTAVIPTLAPEVAHFEPRVALDGGHDGLDVIRRLVADARPRLAAGGALVLETAGGGQVPEVVRLLQTAGFIGVETCPDLAGVERFVTGRNGCRRDS
jgi:release factor glutamine methyltransferase